MNHTDFLRIVDVLEANTRLCSRIIGVTEGSTPIWNYSGLRDEVETTKKLITDLKVGISSKIEAQSDGSEDSDHQSPIYTPSHTESHDESNNDTSDLDQIAGPPIDTPEQSSLSKVDVITIRDTLAPSLKKLANKDDVLAPLKHNIAQRDQFTDFCDEARVIDGVNTKAATAFQKTLVSKIDTLQKDLESLADNVAGLDVKIERLRVQSETDMAQLRTDLSDRAEHAVKPNLMSNEQYNSLKKDIVAAVEEKSARQISQLRDDILQAVRTVGLGNTVKEGPTMGSNSAPARPFSEICPGYTSQ